MGVPEKSKDFLKVFSRNLSYEKCNKSELFTKRTIVGGATETCDA